MNIQADHFDKSIQEELEPAITAYEEKSKGKTIMVSTPNAPGGLFERIEHDKNSKYNKLFLDYTYGLDKIYDRAFIEKKKLEPEFEREYNLHYLGKVGNIFNPSQIDKALELGELYSLDKIPTNDYTLRSCGVDFGYGSSRTAIVLTEFLKEERKIRVLYAEEFEHANPQDIVDLCFNLYRKHFNTWFFCGGANRGAINLMKSAWGESLNWEKQQITPESMRILPVNFAIEHKQMLAHLVLLASKSYLAIPKEFDKLSR